MGAVVAFLTSRAAKYGAAVLGVLAVLLKIFYSGARAERAKVVKQNLVEIADAQKIDDAVAGRDAAANRGRLRRWARD